MSRDRRWAAASRPVTGRRWVAAASSMPPPSAMGPPEGARQSSPFVVFAVTVRKVRSVSEKATPFFGEVENDPQPAFRERNAREELVTPITGKWCCRCRRWLPADAFLPDSRLLSGLNSWCRSCHADANREWREKYPEHVELYNAKRRAEYRAAHPRKLRPCVVCGEPFTSRPNALVCGENCRRQRKMSQRRASRGKISLDP
jgi:predicted nucleic acid-binding Zn ribbon protein